MQILRNAYFWNRWTNILHSKFYVMDSGFGHLPICPIWACSWAKNLSNMVPTGSRLGGMHITETAEQIFSIWSSLELSRPVVVQCYGHEWFEYEAIICGVCGTTKWTFGYSALAEPLPNSCLFWTEPSLCISYISSYLCLVYFILPMIICLSWLQTDTEDSLQR